MIKKLQGFIRVWGEIAVILRSQVFQISFLGLSDLISTFLRKSYLGFSFVYFWAFISACVSSHIWLFQYSTNGFSMGHLWNVCISFLVFQIPSYRDCICPHVVCANSSFSDSRISYFRFVFHNSHYMIFHFSVSQMCANHLSAIQISASELLIIADLISGSLMGPLLDSQYVK